MTWRKSKFVLDCFHCFINIGNEILNHYLPHRQHSPSSWHSNKLKPFAFRNWTNMNLRFYYVLYTKVLYLILWSRLWQDTSFLKDTGEFIILESRVDVVSAFWANFFVDKWYIFWNILFAELYCHCLLNCTVILSIDNINICKLYYKSNQPCMQFTTVYIHWYYIKIEIELLNPLQTP